MNTQIKTLMYQRIFNSNTCRILFATCFSALCLAALSAEAATITVMNSTDSGPGSLRQALADAADGDTINFNSSLNGQTITLTSGELLVNKSLIIIGPGANTLAVDANHASRVFHIASGKDVTISGLSITNGSAPNYYFGGGVYNDHANLTVSNCTISGNSVVGGFGGGICNDLGTLTVSSTTFSGNSGWYGGGGIAVYTSDPSGSATVTMTNCTLSDNSASYGGAIYNEFGTMTVSNCTVSGNSTTFGAGGIENGGATGIGTMTLNNSTVSGNSASNYTDTGGGIQNNGTLTITSSTISGNSTVGAGGGIGNNWGATLTMANSTLSGNSAGRVGGGICNDHATLKIGNTILKTGASGENIVNSDGTVISLGYNLSSDNGGGYLTAAGDHINTDPRLGPLQDNGGPTFTHLPASDSPAIDAGDPTLGMDQRGPGFVRMTNGRIDIGAIEVQATPTPTPTPTPKPHGHH